jgi:hypothetical protein
MNLIFSQTAEPTNLDLAHLFLIPLLLILAALWVARK